MKNKKTKTKIKSSFYKSSKSFFNEEKITAYLCVLPNLLLIAIFILYPAGFALFVSMHKWDMFTSKIFVGMGNYIHLFGDNVFLLTMKNTFEFVLFSVPTIIVLSLLIAVLIDQVVFGKVFFQTIVFLPAVTSEIAVCQVFKWLYVPSYGPIFLFLNNLGLKAPDFLGEYNWAMPSLIVVGIWLRLAFTSIVYLAALQSIPNELYEAATVDGANAWKKLTKITIPMLRNTTFFLIVVNMIHTFRFFTPIYTLTRGGPMQRTDMLMYYIYRTAFENYKMGYASAASFVLFIIILILAIIQRRILTEE